MARSPTTADSELDALYGLALDEFIAARDGLARRLRSDGDRDAAGRAQQLRKPSVAAWALNQVSRRDGAMVEALLAAGERLRAAQNRLLETGGEPGALREAAAAQRSALEDVAAGAERALEQAGHGSGATIQNKLLETLQAAIRDPSLGELLRTGRLLREAQIGDLGLGEVDLAGALAASTAAEASIPAAKASTPARAAPRPDPALARRRRTLEGRLERARAQQSELDQARRSLEREAKAAAGEAEKAGKAAARAAERAGRARSQAETAAARWRELADELAGLEH
jgi:hypothetical protein